MGATGGHAGRVQGDTYGYDRWRQEHTLGGRRTWRAGCWRARAHTEPPGRIQPCGATGEAALIDSSRTAHDWGRHAADRCGRVCDAI
eukprot:scaffold9607_cov113-Isochrysis_galbana.AAC.1